MKTLSFNMAGLLFMLLLVLSFPSYVSTTHLGNETLKLLNKRELNWNASGYIISSSGNNFDVQYLQPHAKCEAVDESVGATSFVLYIRGGNTIVPNTGIFHFVNGDTADRHRPNCIPGTLHAGAYHYFYDSCPNDDALIVASGYCYNARAQALGFNSHTFNNPRKSYLNGNYYKQNCNGKSVNSVEQTILAYCYDAWKNAGFPVNTWRCSTRNMGKRSVEGTRMKRETGICKTCTCDGGSVGGSSRIEFALIPICFLPLVLLLGL